MFEKLKALLAKQLKIDPEKITRESNIRRDFDVNSIELAEFVLSLEDEFDCEIDDRAVSKLATVGEIADYLERELS